MLVTVSVCKFATDNIPLMSTSPVKFAPVKSAFNSSNEREVDASVLNPAVNTSSVERAVDASVLNPVVNTDSAERAVDASAC